jgi:hypothetical protein
LGDKQAWRQDGRDGSEAEVGVMPPERAVEEAARPGWGGGNHDHDGDEGREGLRGRGKVSLELRGRGAPIGP